MNSFLSIQYSFQRYFIHLWKIIRIGGRIHSINLESRQYFVDEVWTRHASIESLLGDAFTYSHACTRVPIGTQYSGTYGNIATRIGESRSRTTCNRMIAVNTCVTCASKLEQKLEYRWESRTLDLWSLSLETVYIKGCVARINYHHYS